MQTITQNIPDDQVDQWDAAFMGTDFAFDVGFEDATEEVDQNGSAIFTYGSQEWDAYNEGYLAGLEFLHTVHPDRLQAAIDLVERATTDAAAPVIWGMTTTQEVLPC